MIYKDLGQSQPYEHDQNITVSHLLVTLREESSKVNKEYNCHSTHLIETII